jgi:hypothetical protein
MQEHENRNADSSEDVLGDAADAERGSAIGLPNTASTLGISELQLPDPPAMSANVMMDSDAPWSLPSPDEDITAPATWQHNAETNSSDDAAAAAADLHGEVTQKQSTLASTAASFLMPEPAASEQPQVTTIDSAQLSHSSPEDWGAFDVFADGAAAALPKSAEIVSSMQQNGLHSTTDQSEATAAAAAAAAAVDDDVADMSWQSAADVLQQPTTVVATTDAKAAVHANGAAVDVIAAAADSDDWDDFAAAATENADANSETAVDINGSSSSDHAAVDTVRAVASLPTLSTSSSTIADASKTADIASAADAASDVYSDNELDQQQQQQQLRNAVNNAESAPAVYDSSNADVISDDDADDTAVETVDTDNNSAHTTAQQSAVQLQVLTASHTAAIGSTDDLAAISTDDDDSMWGDFNVEVAATEPTAAAIDTAIHDSAAAVISDTDDDISGDEQNAATAGTDTKRVHVISSSTAERSTAAEMCHDAIGAPAVTDDGVDVIDHFAAVLDSEQQHADDNCSDLSYVHVSLSEAAAAAAAAAAAVVDSAATDDDNDGAVEMTSLPLHVTGAQHEVAESSTAVIDDNDDADDTDDITLSAHADITEVDTDTSAPATAVAAANDFTDTSISNATADDADIDETTEAVVADAANSAATAADTADTTTADTAAAAVNDCDNDANAITDDDDDWGDFDEATTIDSTTANGTVTTSRSSTDTTAATGTVRTAETPFAAATVDNGNDWSDFGNFDDHTTSTSASSVQTTAAVASAAAVQTAAAAVVATATTDDDQEWNADFVSSYATATDSTATASTHHTRSASGGASSIGAATVPVGVSAEQRAALLKRCLQVMLYSNTFLSPSFIIFALLFVRLPLCCGC